MKIAGRTEIEQAVLEGRRCLLEQIEKSALLIINGCAADSDEQCALDILALARGARLTAAGLEEGQ